MTELVAEISCESVKNESKNWNKMREKTGTKWQNSGEEEKYEKDGKVEKKLGCAVFS